MTYALEGCRWQVSATIRQEDETHTWAGYVAVIKDDVDVLQARGVARLEKARGEEGAEEALWGCEYGCGGRVGVSTNGLYENESV